MKLNDLPGFLLALFVAIVCVVGYVQHTRLNIVMDGVTYTHAGMAELQPGIYAPVYRRLK